MILMVYLGTGQLVGHGQSCNAFEHEYILF